MQQSKPPMSMSDWMLRDLPEPDLLMGFWLSTTSRALVVAETGLGKTNTVIAAGMRVAAGKDFLHWKGRRPARVLYIDGEMSSRLLKQRLEQEMRRVGSMPEGFFAVCAADLQDFRPLNTREGQDAIWKIIDEIGGVDLVIFDSIMSLVSGSMIEEGPWSETMPLVHALTKRHIGQIWVHHMGHKGGHSYGTKTREWQMDAVLILEPRKDNRSNVSFGLTFAKARERMPETQQDFQDVFVALIDDQWTVELTAEKSRRAAKVSPKAATVLKALGDVIGQGQITRLANGRHAASDADWRTECERQGILDPTKPASARALFHRYRNELMEADLIEHDEALNWLAA